MGGGESPKWKRINAVRKMHLGMESTFGVYVALLEGIIVKLSLVD